MCCQVWWHWSSIPALRKQRQADLCEFEANLIYMLSLDQPEFCRKILSENIERKIQKYKQKR